jgi:hypothetical protein
MKYFASDLTHAVKSFEEPSGLVLSRNPEKNVFIIEDQRNWKSEDVRENLIRRLLLRLTSNQ